MIHHLAERIEYARDELAWLESGAKEGEEPWLGWETGRNGKYNALQCAPWWDGKDYRRRPKMLSCIDAKGVPHEWPEPMREAPAKGTHYNLVDVPGCVTTLCSWNDDTFDVRWLAAGLCQATEEGAQQQLAALRAICRGGDI